MHFDGGRVWLFCLMAKNGKSRVPACLAGFLPFFTILAPPHVNSLTKSFFQSKFSIRSSHLISSRFAHLFSPPPLPGIFPKPKKKSLSSSFSCMHASAPSFRPLTRSLSPTLSPRQYLLPALFSPKTFYAHQ